MRTTGLGSIMIRVRSFLLSREWYFDTRLVLFLFLLDLPT